ncbi:MAG: hypothetical protein QXU52_00390 [Fervidicoccaceae archaeon]
MRRGELVRLAMPAALAGLLALAAVVATVALASDGDEIYGVARCPFHCGVGWKQGGPMWNKAKWMPPLKIGPKLEVSEDFKAAALSVAASDPDVEALIGSGYNVTNVIPLIKVVVYGDGSVQLKATQALVVLVKAGEGKATALVDLENKTVVQLSVSKLRTAPEGRGASGA